MITYEFNCDDGNMLCLLRLSMVADLRHTVKEHAAEHRPIDFTLTSSVPRRTKHFSEIDFESAEYLQLRLGRLERRQHNVPDITCRLIEVEAHLVLSHTLAIALSSQRIDLPIPTPSSKH